MITVTFNGKIVDLDELATVKHLLLQYDLPLQGIAVEVDGKIVPRSQWEEFRLPPDAAVEVVQMVGGGT